MVTMKILKTLSHHSNFLDHKTPERNREEEVDRLSNLPTDVLVHILSFLDTKSAIRASNLAKKYRNLWTLSPNLYFRVEDPDADRFKYFYDHPAGLEPEIASVESNLNSVLQQRERDGVPITGFRLSLHRPITSEFIEDCSAYAARHNVLHLRIRGLNRNSVPHARLRGTLKPAILPRALLTLSSLVTLRLNDADRESIELPKAVSLPNLKLLHLKNFDFSDENYNGEVFSGCPTLENLILNKCFIRRRDELKILDINCSQLKNLEIRRWRSQWVHCFGDHTINVNAPRLGFFKLQGCLVRVNFKNDVLPCLDESIIDSYVPIALSSERRERVSGSLLSILHQIRNVKSLSLSMKTIQLLNAVPDLRLRAVSTFDNLKFIKITAENIHTKTTIPISHVKQFLTGIDGDNLEFFASIAENIHSEATSPTNYMKQFYESDALMSIIPPSEVLQFILESSPCAQTISVQSQRKTYK